jgi:hypothetical protein
MERYAAAYIEPKLFWSAGFFVIVGPSGSGKTTIIKDALTKPNMYIDLREKRTATLWVLVGASHDLEKELQKELNRTVFTKVNFVTQRIGECVSLHEAIKNNDGKGSHYVFIDDYMTYSRSDALFLRRMLHAFRRHEHMCVVVALHNLLRDSTGIVWDMVDHSDRVFFTKCAGNIRNLEAFFNRLRIPLPMQKTVRKEFAADRCVEPKDKRYAVAMFDRKSTLLVSDVKALLDGGDPTLMYCYGESASLRVLHDDTKHR